MDEVIEDAEIVEPLELPDELRSIVGPEPVTNVIDLRARVITKNLEMVRQLRSMGMQFDGNVAIAARVETILDMLWPEGTIEREQYMLGVELRLHGTFSGALAEALKPKLELPGTPMLPPPAG